MSQTGEQRDCEYIFAGTRNRCGTTPEHPVHIYGRWGGPEEYHAFQPYRATPPERSGLDVRDAHLPWHRETVGHLSTAGIAAIVAADLNVPLDEGLPPNTDATWIVDSGNKVVAFVGNGKRQTRNADLIIEAVARLSSGGEDRP